MNKSKGCTIILISAFECDQLECLNPLLFHEMTWYDGTEEALKVGRVIWMIWIFCAGGISTSTEHWKQKLKSWCLMINPLKYYSVLLRVIYC